MLSYFLFLYIDENLLVLAVYHMGIPIVSYKIIAHGEAWQPARAQGVIPTT
jgi:hypothetical protein